MMTSRQSLKLKECLRAHLTEYWPESSVEFFKWTYPGTMTALPDFRVARIGDNSFDKSWVYVSKGIASLTSCRLCGHEYAITSPMETPRRVETLAMLANFITAEQGDFSDLGQVFDIGRPWLEGSTMKHLMVSLPYPYGPRFENVHCADRDIKIRWLLPIHRSEREFLGSNGLEALEEKFDAAKLSYLDPFRAPVV